MSQASIKGQVLRKINVNQESSQVSLGCCLNNKKLVVKKPHVKVTATLVKARVPT